MGEATSVCDAGSSGQIWELQVVTAFNNPWTWDLGLEKETQVRRLPRAESHLSTYAGNNPRQNKVGGGQRVSSNVGPVSYSRHPTPIALNWLRDLGDLKENMTREKIRGTPDTRAAVCLAHLSHGAESIPVTAQRCGRKFKSILCLA